MSKLSPHGFFEPGSDGKSMQILHALEKEKTNVEAGGIRSRMKFFVCSALRAICPGLPLFVGRTIPHRSGQFPKHVGGPTGCGSNVSRGTYTRQIHRPSMCVEARQIHSR